MSQIHERPDGLEYRHVPSYEADSSGFRATLGSDRSSDGAVVLTYLDGGDLRPDCDLAFWDEEDIDGLIAYLERVKELLPA